jgi:GT2 family glycosyltransferase
VVLAHGDEPWLSECVEALLASCGVDLEVVVVDNDARAADLARMTPDPAVRLLRPGRNTGFAGGCNLGAAALSAPFVALVNSDCLVAPDTLRRLADEAADPGRGPVMASIRFADRPAILNSAGNPVHVLGTCWAGGIEERETRTEPFDVPAASGACLVLRRAVWDALGGFDEEYFAYLEDTELSLRCWRRGLSARCVPLAVARHHYEFSRNPRKMYLLERNRLILLATLWPRPVLWRLSPLLAAFEITLLLLATVQGWGGGKVAGWRWVWTHRAHLRRRRRMLAAERTVPDEVWMGHLTTAFAPHVIGSPAATRVVNVVVGVWWSVARPRG